MTSPVSAIEAIEKAIHLGIAYDDLLRKLEGPQEFLFAGDVAAIDAAYDAWVCATRSASKLLPEVLALARQAEALQRENAEKDAEIAKLRGMIRDNGTPRFNAVCDRAEAAERDNERLRAVLGRLKEATPISTNSSTAKEAFSFVYAVAATALLGGSENAE